MEDAAPHSIQARQKVRGKCVVVIFVVRVVDSSSAGCVEDEVEKDTLSRLVGCWKHDARVANARFLATGSAGGMSGGAYTDRVPITEVAHRYSSNDNGDCSRGEAASNNATERGIKCGEEVVADDGDDGGAVARASLLLMVFSTPFTRSSPAATTIPSAARAASSSALAKAAD